MVFKLVKYISFFASPTEMFKSLEREESGKIELNMEQVGEDIIKCVCPYMIIIYRLLIFSYLFPLAVAVPGDLLTQRTSIRKKRREHILKEMNVVTNTLFGLNKFYEIKKISS